MHIRSLKCKQNKNARKRLIEDKNVVAFAQLMKNLFKQQIFFVFVLSYFVFALLLTHSYLSVILSVLINIIFRKEMYHEKIYAK